MARAGSIIGTAAGSRSYDFYVMQQHELIAALLRGLPDVAAIYRFGSFGTNHEHTTSDMDVAVLGLCPYAPTLLWDVAQELAAKIGRDVDLVDLASASTVFKAQVVSGGERIFCADPIYCNEYEAAALSAYARLNEERREILRDIRERGSVYGR